MKNDWTKAARETMHRNIAIQARNRNIDALNAMLGTKFTPMELEPIPTPQHPTGDKQ